MFMAVDHLIQAQNGMPIRIDPPLTRKTVDLSLSPTFAKLKPYGCSKVLNLYRWIKNSTATFRLTKFAVEYN